MLLQGALDAEKLVLLKLNVSKDQLDEVVSILPSMHAPTVNSLADSAWFSVESVAQEIEVRDLIPRLKAAGATGIIELSLNKIVP